MGISDEEVFKVQHDVLDHVLNGTNDETVRRVAWLGEQGIASTEPAVRSTIEETFKLLPDSVHHLYDIENQAKKITSYDGIEVELFPWDIREDWNITGYDLVVMFRTSVHAKSRDHFLQQLELLVKNNQSVVIDITLYGGQLQCSYDDIALNTGMTAPGHEYFGEQGRDNFVYFDIRDLITNDAEIRFWPEWTYSSHPNHRNLLMSDEEMKHLFWNIPLSTRMEYDTITSKDIMLVNGKSLNIVSTNLVTNGLIDKEGLMHAKENRLGVYASLNFLNTIAIQDAILRDIRSDVGGETIDDFRENLIRAFENEFEESLKSYSSRAMMPDITRADIEKHDLSDKLSPVAKLSGDWKIKIQLMCYLCWQSHAGEIKPVKSIAVAN